MGVDKDLVMGLLWLISVIGWFCGFGWAIWTVSKEIRSRVNPKGSPSNLESESTTKINSSDEATQNSGLYKKATRAQILILMLIWFVAIVLALQVPNYESPPGWPENVVIETTSTTTIARTTTTTTDPNEFYRPQNEYICWTGSYFGDDETEERTLTECNP